MAVVVEDVRHGEEEDVRLGEEITEGVGGVRARHP
jgi:hypothetical protein